MFNGVFKLFNLMYVLLWFISFCFYFNFYYLFAFLISFFNYFLLTFQLNLLISFIGVIEVLNGLGNCYSIYQIHYITCYLLICFIFYLLLVLTLI